MVVLPQAGRTVRGLPDPEGAVTAALPLQRAVGCVVFAATEIEAPGVVRHFEGTRFSIGEPDGSISSRCTEFSEAMIAGGLKCPVEPDLRSDIWVKLMGNIAFNPISATMAGICRHAGTRELVTTMMRETIDVAERVGSHVDVSIERRLAGAERTGEHKTSTLQGLERGKPMELNEQLAPREPAPLAPATTPAVMLTVRARRHIGGAFAQSWCSKRTRRAPVGTADDRSVVYSLPAGRGVRRKLLINALGGCDDDRAGDSRPG